MRLRLIAQRHRCSRQGSSGHAAASGGGQLIWSARNPLGSGVNLGGPPAAGPPKCDCGVGAGACGQRSISQPPAPTH
jgi:hypothetical protein